MAKKIYVYSTLTAAQLYTKWSKPPEGSMVPEKLLEVHIHGGSNLANKLLVTPIGVRTEVTQEEHDYLLTDPHFQQHAKKGFVQIREEKLDPEVVVGSGMEQKDKSAPVTPHDYSDKKGDDADGIVVPRATKAKGR